MLLNKDMLIVTKPKVQFMCNLRKLKYRIFYVFEITRANWKIGDLSFGAKDLDFTDKEKMRTPYFVKV